MSKIEIRNSTLRSLWLLHFAAVLLIAAAIHQGLLPLNPVVLILAFIFMALGLIFLYQWSVANRFVYTEQDLSLREWSKGLLYHGLWGPTVESKIPLADIKEFWLSDFSALRARAKQTNDFQLGNQLRYPPDADREKLDPLPVANIVYKDGRIHLTNTRTFSPTRLRKIAAQLERHGISIRKF
ncbi:MAG: hypothetical protein LBT22_08330 [Peptococcaceae bacterium]|nr:hypothetical protein [Peptococcaceae bacterium]